MTTRPSAIGPACTDLSLLRLAQAGDEAAFGVLVARHTRVVEHTVRRMAGSATQDVAQQAFLSAWLGLRRFDPERGSVRSWLCRIAHNRAIDLHRRERRHGAQSSLEDAVDGLACPCEGPADVAERGDRAAEVRRAVGRLGVEQRTVIALGYFAGLTQTEIQQRTQTPLGTVKSRTRLALATLRDELPAAA